MTAIAYALYAIGLVLVIGVVVVHVKRDPKLSAELKAEFDKLHVASEHLMDHLHAIHQVASAPTAVAFIPIAQPAAPAPPAAPAAPAPAPVVNDTDPVAPGFVAPPAAAPAPAPAAPAPIDTSGATLDFNVVTGLPIDLNGPKTIVNCPAHVVVRANQASGQSGAHNTYTIVVNAMPIFMPNVMNEYVSSNYGLDVTGPTVTVSVDSPGLQMEISAA